VKKPVVTESTANDLTTSTRGGEDISAARLSEPDSVNLATTPTPDGKRELPADDDDTITSLAPSTPHPTVGEPYGGQPNSELEIEPQGEVPDLEETKVPGNEPSTPSTTENSRAAIIGRIGLAGAREAPNGQATEERETGTTTSPVNKHGSIEADSSMTKSTAAESSSPAVVNPDDLKESGEVEDPESPRSAPPPPHGSKSSLFGRIGHPGAGRHELEQANEASVPKDDQEKKEKVEIKWNEEELKRDPGKTIVSPDTKRKE
jgi:hypothetical protein